MHFFSEESVYRLVDFTSIGEMLCLVVMRSLTIRKSIVLVKELRYMKNVSRSLRWFSNKALMSEPILLKSSGGVI